jgi:hypothetical protein
MNRLLHLESMIESARGGFYPIGKALREVSGVPGIKNNLVPI